MGIGIHVVLSQWFGLLLFKERQLIYMQYSNICIIHSDRHPYHNGRLAI